SRESNLPTPSQSDKQELSRPSLVETLATSERTADPTSREFERRQREDRIRFRALNSPGGGGSAYLREQVGTLGELTAATGRSSPAGREGPNGEPSPQRPAPGMPLFARRERDAAREADPGWPDSVLRTARGQPGTLGDQLRLAKTTPRGEILRLKRRRY